MDFPLTGLMDEDACYARLVEALHPDGLACPRCGGARLGIHRRHREPVIDYRCRDCRRVFNAFTGTALHKTSRRPSALVLILRGVAQGATTARMARELGCDRMKLLELRHKLQANAVAGLDPEPLPDATAEADECYVNAGEKRHAPSRPGGPTAAAGQQAARPRHLRQRPAAGGRDDRPRLGSGVPARRR
jgi:transposase-like protein